MKEEVPVIPCGVESFGWSLKNRRACCVVYGQPVVFDGLQANGRGYKRAAAIIRLEILRLWRQAAEAVAARGPAVLPDGTRRESWPRAREFRPAPTSRRVSGLV